MDSKQNKQHKRNLKISVVLKRNAKKKEKNTNDKRPASSADHCHPIDHLHNY